MAKKKVGRPRKKRKYTKRKNVKTLQDAMKQAKSGDTIFVNPPTQGPSTDSAQIAQSALTDSRASSNAYVFIAGNRVLIRNLSDEYLNTQYELVCVETHEMRQQIDKLDSLRFQMSMEQKFRGLK